MAMIFKHSTHISSINDSPQPSIENRQLIVIVELHTGKCKWSSEKEEKTRLALSVIHTIGFCLKVDSGAFPQVVKITDETEPREAVTTVTKKFRNATDADSNSLRQFHEGDLAFANDDGKTSPAYFSSITISTDMSKDMVCLVLSQQMHYHALLKNMGDETDGSDDENDQESFATEMDDEDYDDGLSSFVSKCSEITISNNKSALSGRDVYIEKSRRSD